MDDDSLTIGALAGRIGVSTSALRAWERRYGLLNPVRSDGGYRYYRADDEARVRRLLRLRSQGVPMAEAAARVLAQASPCPPEATALVLRLIDAVKEMDPLAFDQAWEEGAAMKVTDLVACVALPLMRRVGEEWAAGTLSVSHEHFASNEVRARLFALRPTRPLATGPRALVACPPGERHDLGALAFAVMLGHHGWQVRFLGADTPLATLVLAGRQVRPDLVVLSATRDSAIEGRRVQLSRLARTWPLALGGAGATAAAVAQVLGATRLSQDPTEALVQAESLLTLASA